MNIDREASGIAHSVETGDEIFQAGSVYPQEMTEDPDVKRKPPGNKDANQQAKNKNKGNNDANTYRK